MRVALAQMPVVSDVSENVKTLLRAVRFAVDQRADVLLTPEGSLSGYTHQFDIESVGSGFSRGDDTGPGKPLSAGVGHLLCQRRCQLL